MSTKEMVNIIAAITVFAYWLIVVLVFAHFLPPPTPMRCACPPAAAEAAK